MGGRADASHTAQATGGSCSGPGHAPSQAACEDGGPCTQLRGRSGAGAGGVAGVSRTVTPTVPLLLTVSPTESRSLRQDTDKLGMAARLLSMSQAQRDELREHFASRQEAWSIQAKR